MHEERYFLHFFVHCELWYSEDRLWFMQQCLLNLRFVTLDYAPITIKHIHYWRRFLASEQLVEFFFYSFLEKKIWRILFLCRINWLFQMFFFFVFLNTFHSCMNILCRGLYRRLWSNQCYYLLQEQTVVAFYTILECLFLVLEYRHPHIDGS